MAEAIYMDHNATAPVLATAADAAVRAMSVVGNASSVHAGGRAARAILDEARDAVADLVGVGPDAVIFTSGGTEANGLALRGTERKTVLVSAIEHRSVLNAVGADCRLPVDDQGVIDLAALEQRLSNCATPALVSVMLANNETGVIQPIAEVGAIAKRFGALVHVDAVQAAGKIAIDAPALGIDLMSLSAHKIGGLQGAGALIVVNPTKMVALTVGGGQERGLRAGTENLPGIAAFGAAARHAAQGLQEFQRLAALRDRLEAAAKTRVSTAICFGDKARRLANTTCLALPGVAAETQVMALDLAGVMVSAGSACSSGKVARSHVLEAMNAGQLAAEAIRISLGPGNDEGQVLRFVEAWADLAARKGLATDKPGGGAARAAAE